MKSLWQTCFMVMAVAVSAGLASGQEIGSYQSILARAGYGGENPLAVQQAMAQQNSGQTALPSAQSAMQAQASVPRANVQVPAPQVTNQVGSNVTYGMPVQSGTRVRGNGSPRSGRVTFKNTGWDDAFNDSDSSETKMEPQPIRGEVAPAEQPASVGCGCGDGSCGNISGDCSPCGDCDSCESSSCLGGKRCSGGLARMKGRLGRGQFCAGSGPMVAPAMETHLTPSMETPASMLGAPSEYGTSYADYGVATCNSRPVYRPGQNLVGRLQGMGNNSNACGNENGGMLGGHLNGNLGGNLRNRMAASGGSGTNLVGSVFGLVMRRDYEDARALAYDGAGNLITTRDIEHGDMSGLGFSLTGRNCDGTGWEALYWELDEWDRLDIAGPTTTALGGLAAVNHPPSGANVWQIYNSGDSAYIVRESDIDNFEFNLLRNGGSYTTRTGKSANYELLGGFRMFRFDEALRYVSNSTAAGYPAVMNYDVEVDNTLVGFHLGGRSEICLSQKMRLAYGANVGLFNNRIRSRQELYDDSLYYPGNFNYYDEKDDAAMLGQFDIGLIYALTAGTRLRVGYHAMGVAGVALAADQIPYDFTDINGIQNANSNGDLLLHGVYFGGEACF